jgi:serine/threonine protein kinase
MKPADDHHPAPGNEADEDNPRVMEALREYQAALDAGRRPSRRDFLSRYADVAAELADCLYGLELLRSGAPGLGGQKRAPVPEAALSSEGTLGDFRILREVGRGGMGVVYEAEQISLRRRVALKVLPFAAAIDARQLQRFKNEALAAAHLRHEHIVPVYAVGCERGVHYYAMQFIDGQSLAALIGELRRLAPSPSPSEGEEISGAGPRPAEGPSQPGEVAADTDPYCPGGAAETLPGEAERQVAASISRERSSGRRRYFDRVAGLVRQAALALEHAHQAGVVHRDVKPANLLLDPRGQLWVTDFGLAQINNEAGLTLTGEVLGTLRYASPEQALARPGLVDHRSDVYALGATLYELLTLRPIFDGRDRHELLRQITHDEPQPPRSADGTIPVELETIVLKAVAKEPSERYVTAQELADDLQRFLEDQPIRARRPSLAERATKWVRRHHAMVALALAALLVVVAGLSVATALTARAYEREREKAREAAEQRARSEENFRKALEAVDQLVRIGEKELAGKPELEGLRWGLLEAALEYYRGFIDQRQDDPTIRRELENSQRRVEAILGELTTLAGAPQYIPLHWLEVQDELGLSEDQRLEIREIQDGWYKGFHEFSRLSPAEREQRKLRLAQDQEFRVARLLKPSQLQRFKQIALQFLGPDAFSDPAVASTLLLDAGQKKEIRMIQEAAKRSPDGGPDKESHARAIAAAREHALGQILNVLRPDQRQKWEELTGEPFAFQTGGNHRR